MQLEQHFTPFRRATVGHDARYRFRDREQTIVYADWTASGRLYEPIERFIQQRLGPFVANTHTETTLTGTAMTGAYHEAQQIIKRHVNASADDVLVAAEAGMTGVVNKFQRMLGLRLPEKWRERIDISEAEKPLVLVTHMEHHSNQTSWDECAVDVRIVRRKADGLPDLAHLRELLRAHAHRGMKIGAFTACSNVTGIKTPYHDMAAIMHEHGGFCFVDFAASAPYVPIDMHPADPAQKLDAIMFSPHKFLGGPGSSGILVFDKRLYHNRVPDHPGGGTVAWTNPWGEHHFFEDIEVREDGGTPPFLQTIRAALAVKLKERMGMAEIAAREHDLASFLLDELNRVEGVRALEPQQRERLAIVSFYVENAHHNLVVRLLNDRFGVQARGGCSCAGTYGHILLNVDRQRSHAITRKIDRGDLSDKPGWVRLSLHPTNTDAEARWVVRAVRETVAKVDEWKKAYRFSPASGDWQPRSPQPLAVTLADFDALDEYEGPATQLGTGSAR